MKTVIANRRSDRPSNPDEWREHEARGERASVAERQSFRQRIVMLVRGASGATTDPSRTLMQIRIGWLMGFSRARTQGQTSGVCCRVDAFSRLRACLRAFSMVLRVKNPRGGSARNAASGKDSTQRNHGECTENARRGVPSQSGACGLKTITSAIFSLRIEPRQVVSSIAPSPETSPRAPR